jgi:hypothetical protein
MFMGADRVSCDFIKHPGESQDSEAIWRDLERLIYEALPTPQAEAYIARLHELLRDIRAPAVDQ